MFSLFIIHVFQMIFIYFIIPCRLGCFANWQVKNVSFSVPLRVNFIFQLISVSFTLSLSHALYFPLDDLKRIPRWIPERFSIFI